MTGLVEALNYELQDRERYKKRCKVAPTEIATHGQAFEAWQRYQQYRGMADSAFTKYMQAPTGGSVTARRHHARYEAYSDIADGWESALNNWLEGMAQLEAHGTI